MDRLTEQLDTPRPSSARRYVVQLTPEATPWPEMRRFVAPLVGLGDPPADVTAVLATASPEDGGVESPIKVIAGGRPRLLFDAAATIETIVEEQYDGAALSEPIVSRLPVDYSLLPQWLVGKAAQILGRPLDIARLPSFPSYPLDVSADAIAILADQKAPGSLVGSPALVLTHDVDTSWLFDDRDGRGWLERFVSAEEKLGLRSAWYCVPLRMRSTNSQSALARLSDAGHEIGVHGLSHDPNLATLPPTRLAEMLERARLALEPFAAVGYRSPWLSRTPGMYRSLAQAGFRYDSSAPTTDFQRNNSVSNNGCGTIFPFCRQGMLVLPITLPQDNIRIRRRLPAAEFWRWLLGIARRIQAMGGAVVVTTHIQAHHSAQPQMLDGYRELLEEMIGSGMKGALPREVAVQSGLACHG